MRRTENCVVLRSRYAVYGLKETVCVKLEKKARSWESLAPCYPPLAGKPIRTVATRAIWELKLENEANRAISKGFPFLRLGTKRSLRVA